MIVRLMQTVRTIILIMVLAASCGAPVQAQDDPSKGFFSAYQEYQRGERLEREGRAADAIAKFRYVATQLSQIKAQNPDWQPLVVDFRLRRTQEAIVRLEGSLDSPTLGPPPDLVMTDGGEDDVLPPVRPPRRESVPPTISISLGGEDAESGEAVVAADAGAAGADVDKLRQQLQIERKRGEQLETELKQNEADLLNVSMELEKTKVSVVDLNTQLRQLKEVGESGASQSGGAQEELQRLTDLAQKQEETLAAAAAEKEELQGQVQAKALQIDELTGRLTTAQQEAEAAKTRAGELEQERDTLVTARDEAVRDAASAKEEIQRVAARVLELEEERTQLIAARDEAQLQATEAKSALEKSAELIEANRLLEEKLTEAAGKIEGMESDASAKEQVIAGLQGDLDKVRAELADAQTKLQDDRARFDQLQAVNDQLLKQYDEVTGALAAIKLGDVTAADAKIIQEENEVLRGIIMRQIKEQARREQAYRLAQEEMARLEIRSDTLNDKINELAKPTLELTETEQEMLKRPVITLMDTDANTGTISAAIEVLKPQVGNSLAGEAAPSSSSATAPAPAPAPEDSTATVSSEATAGAGQTLPPEVVALINEARDQFVRGNFSGAEKLYQQFLDLQPDNVVALANLGVSQFRQGKLTAAQLALEKAIKVSPDDAFSLTTLGAVMIEQNRIDDAIAYLERANSSVTDDPITLNYLGVASSQIGQFGKAEQALRRAVTVKPDYAEAHFNLAVIYATAKPPSIALAKRHYEKALELGAGPDKRLAAMLKDDSGS
jgi:Flp pilus assembly protein TadD